MEGSSLAILTSPWVPQCQKPTRAFPFPDPAQLFPPPSCFFLFKNVEARIPFA